MTDQTCPILVHPGGTFRGRPCGRPVKLDGLCGVHWAAQKRKLDNAAARSASRAHQTAERDRMQKLCDRLAALGITAYPATSSAGNITGKVVVDPNALIPFLEKAARS